MNDDALMWIQEFTDIWKSGLYSYFVFSHKEPHIDTDTLDRTMTTHERDIIILTKGQHDLPLERIQKLLQLPYFLGVYVHIYDTNNWVKHEVTRMYRVVIELKFELPF